MAHFAAVEAETIGYIAACARDHTTQGIVAATSPAPAASARAMYPESATPPDVLFDSHAPGRNT